MHVAGTRGSTILIALVAGAAAHAQSINIDLGANSPSAPVPSSSYGAAASQPGVWNAVSAAPAVGIPLNDLLGGATPVTLTISGGQGDLESNDPGTFGDDQSLMDDVGSLAATGVGSTATYTFNNLAPGNYDVYVYGWTPGAAATSATAVDAPGGVPCAQICGNGVWPGAHAAGITYVVDRVAVTGSTYTITVNSSSGMGACNGIQLEAQAAVPGTVLASFTISNAIESNPRGIVKAFKHYWVSGNGNGPALHRYDLTRVFQETYTSGAPAFITHSGSLLGRVNSVSLANELVVFDTSSVGVYEWQASGADVQCVAASMTNGKTGCAYDYVTGWTWVIEPNGDVCKYTVASNGTLTLVSCWTPAGSLQLKDLAYDFRANVLWGFSRTNPCGGVTNLVEFVPMDPSTGMIVGPGFLGDTTLSAPNLAVACDIDVLDISSGTLAIAAIHETGTDDTVVIYALTSQSSPAPTSYCTAGVSTNGCVPTLSATPPLQPSLDGLYATVLTAAPMEGLKTGLFFYGVSGPQAIPWSGASTSFLCVKAPTQRTPPQSSGGSSNTCTGMLTLDVDSVAGNPGALGQPFTFGQALHFQAWYRDPPASKTTNLTDGLVLVFQP